MTSIQGKLYLVERQMLSSTMIYNKRYAEENKIIKIYIEFFLQFDKLTFRQV